VALDNFSLKARTFLIALERLCKEHQVCLSVSGYDTFQIWDLDGDHGEPWYCNGVEDRTVLDSYEDKA
jgi:hypothetical protein